MNTEKLRIVFMGTPEFAVGILNEIHLANYNVVAVITAPDKPAGRGQKVSCSAVKTYAADNNIMVLQPTNLKDEDFLTTLASLEANLQVVVAFRMLPEVVWKMPKLGTFNLHASLLPQYRGAAPINWALINGENKTGVTTFFIDEKIDTGAIILSDEIEILPNENMGELHDKLMILGSKTVLKTLQLIENDQAITTLQTENNELKSANKLNRENCKINWLESGENIFNLTRGLNPYPAAWCFLNNNETQTSIKIFDAIFTQEQHNYTSGKLIFTKKDIKVAVKNGFIQLLTLQMPGKKKLTAPEVLNGNKFSENSFLS